MSNEPKAERITAQEAHQIMDDHCNAMGYPPEPTSPCTLFKVEPDGSETLLYRALQDVVRDAISKLPDGKYYYLSEHSGAKHWFVIAGGKVEYLGLELCEEPNADTQTES